MNRRLRIVSSWLILLFATLRIATFPISVFASDEPMIEVFVRDGCAHCEAEEAFLSELESRRPELVVRFVDVGEPEGRVLFDRVTEAENLSKATPITVIGTTVIQGFGSADTTGQIILDILDRGISEDGSDGFSVGTSFGRGTNAVCFDGSACSASILPTPAPVSLPFFGSIDVSSYSLPAMAAILGFVDGFNPCAIWVLVTFLLVLVQIGDRKRMFLVAGLFVLAEAAMYYFILNIWLTTWDFVGLDRIVTPIVGSVAVGGGIFFLYEWLRGDGTCKVTDVRKRAKISSRIGLLASGPFTWMTVAGIVALAFSVNVIEFACSIGIPQAFTKIVEMNDLGAFGSRALILLYVLFYLLDDLVLFGLALWGAEKLRSTHAYARWCNFFGGALMIIVGLLLVFRPSLLLF
jgi:cytochrome c biogenesis protein CcdA